MLKRIFLISFLIISINFSFAQSIDRWVISSGSGNFSYLNNIDYTIGQIITPTSNSPLIVTSGFEQPENKSSEKEEKNKICNINQSIFPNPVDNFLTIVITSEFDINSIEIKIFDASGKELYFNSLRFINENYSKTNINLINYESGIYLIQTIINNAYVSNSSIIKK